MMRVLLSSLPYPTWQPPLSYRWTRVFVFRLQGSNATHTFGILRASLLIERVEIRGGLRDY